MKFDQGIKVVPFFTDGWYHFSPVLKSTPLLLQVQVQGKQIFFLEDVKTESFIHFLFKHL